jgi:YihY family inner membrane protein
MVSPYACVISYIEMKNITHVLKLSLKKFSHIDGTQWAGAFAYNAFFSLFPLVILLVTIASLFVDQTTAATEVISFIERYVPLTGVMQQQIFGTISHVIDARKQAGLIAFLFLVWVALQCFSTLICATNRAWDIELHKWWRLPLNSFLLLSIIAGMVFLAMIAPSVIHFITDWFGDFWIPHVVTFLSLVLFYKLAPRRHTRFSEIWIPALCATVLFKIAESAFVIYLTHFATLNVVYGAFGSIMALLLWIYLSGCIFIFGACLCAVQHAKVRACEK